MTANAPIAIIGAGISGLTLARTLLRRGIRSTIYEKSPPPPPTPSTSINSDTITPRSRHNYGITLNADSHSLLSAELSPITPTFLSRISVDNSYYPFPGPDHYAASLPSPLRIHRAHLESLLATGLDIKWHHELHSVVLAHDESSTSNASAIKLSFCTPSATNIHHESHSMATVTAIATTTVTAPLVVGADGVHSVLRTLLLPRIRPHILPYVVFRGQRRVLFNDDATEESFRGRDLCASLLRGGDGVVEIRVKRRGEGAGGGRAVLRVGIDEWDANGGVVSWFYSRSARELRDGDGVEGGVGNGDVLYRPNRGTDGAGIVPEEFYAEIQGLLQDELLNELGDEERELFRWVCNVERMKNGDRVQNFLMRRVVLAGEKETEEALKELAQSGIVFLGDAVHATPIVGSEGANHAIRDAVELADVVEQWQCDVGALSWEAEHDDAVVARKRLFAAIVKFYEAKLAGEDGRYNWKTLGENAEVALARMHDI